jgi:hypothetical protein
MILISRNEKKLKTWNCRTLNRVRFYVGYQSSSLETSFLHDFIKLIEIERLYLIGFREVICLIFVVANLESDTYILNEIASRQHRVVNNNLIEIENASLMTKLYHMTIGNGNIDKAKHQQNLDVLNQFPKFTKSAMTNIHNVINRLQSFKHEIDEIKFSISKMDRAQTLSMDIHMEILKNSLESLQEYKQRFNGRLTKNNRVQG